MAKERLTSNKADGVISIEKVHNMCFLIYVEKNSESPFEFSNEVDALVFAEFLQRFATEEQIEKVLDDEELQTKY